MSPVCVHGEHTREHEIFLETRVLGSLPSWSHVSAVGRRPAQEGGVTREAVGPGAAVHPGPEMEVGLDFPTPFRVLSLCC